MKKTLFPLLAALLFILPVLSMDTKAEASIPPPQRILVHANDDTGHTVEYSPLVDAKYAGYCTFALRSDLMDRENHALIGWNTKPDGSGAWLIPNRQYSAFYDEVIGVWSSTGSFVSGEYYDEILPTDIYAQWQAAAEGHYAVYYNESGMAHGSSMTPILRETPESSIEGTVAAVTLPTASELGFSGQNYLGESMDIYQWSYDYLEEKPDGTIGAVSPAGETVHEEIPLYCAPWWGYRKITIHKNDGTGAFWNQLPESSEYSLNSAPAFSGHIFVGFNTEQDGTGSWYSTETPAGKIPETEVYCQWQETPAQPYVTFRQSILGYGSSVSPITVVLQDQGVYAPPTPLPEIPGFSALGWKALSNKSHLSPIQEPYSNSCLNQLVTSDGTADLTDTRIAYAADATISGVPCATELHMVYSRTTSYSGDPVCRVVLNANTGKFPYASDILWISPSLAKEPADRFIVLPGANAAADTGPSLVKLFQSVPPGKRFAGWNTQADGQGTSYKADSLIELTQDLELYAQWEKKTSTPPSPTEPEQPEEPVRPETPAELPFTYIQTHWAKDSIAWVYEQGLFQGTSPSEFKPDQTMERGMLAAVLYRLAKEPSTGSGLPFADVPGNAYYTDAVKWAASQGIVQGDGLGNYLPKKEITREQLAVMLYRYAGLSDTPEATGDLSAFTDMDALSPYAETAMRWAVGQKIIGGKGNGLLDPKGNATRAEVAAVLQRLAV